MFKRLCAPLMLILSAATLLAQSPAPTASPGPSASASSEACGKFVQQFYHWYLARSNALMKEDSNDSALEVALREKASSFNAELTKVLQEDITASKRSPEEVAGLDFDPFLNAQDTPEKYEVGQVHAKGDHYLVDVFGVWDGKKESKPDVTPELAFEKGNWVFTNFHYEKSDIPENESLLTVLKALKEEREKSEKPAK